VDHWLGVALGIRLELRQSSNGYARMGIGWPIAMALIGAVFGLILAIELRKVS